MNNRATTNIACAATVAVCLFLTGCPGSGGSGSAPIAQTGASISGTVSGTRIVAVNSADQIIAQDDTAGRTPNAQGRFSWQLPNLSMGTNLRIFFLTGGNVYPMYFGNPSSNVFAINGPGTIGLGHVTTAGNQATPYDAIIAATPAQVRLTMVGGVVLYGDDGTRYTFGRRKPSYFSLAAVSIRSAGFNQPGPAPSLLRA